MKQPLMKNGHHQQVASGLTRFWFVRLLLLLYTPPCLPPSSSFSAAQNSPHVRLVSTPKRSSTSHSTPAISAQAALLQFLCVERQSRRKSSIHRHRIGCGSKCFNTVRCHGLSKVLETYQECRLCNKRAFKTENLDQGDSDEVCRLA